MAKARHLRFDAPAAVIRAAAEELEGDRRDAFRKTGWFAQREPTRRNSIAGLPGWMATSRSDP